MNKVELSPTMKVRFADGKVVPMNRKERRALERKTHIKLVPLSASNSLIIRDAMKKTA